MKQVSIAVLAAAALALGACKNGSNNASDTLGIGAGSAAGQVPPGGAPSAVMGDTSAAAAGARAMRDSAAKAGSATASSTDTAGRAKAPAKKKPR